METIRVVLFLFTTILSAAFSHELPDRFSSEKIQLIDERFDGYRGRVNKGALNVTPMIINGFFDVPLNHFEPSDSRQLRLVRILTLKAHTLQFIVLILIVSNRIFNQSLNILRKMVQYSSI